MMRESAERLDFVIGEEETSHTTIWLIVQQAWMVLLGVLTMLLTTHNIYKAMTTLSVESVHEFPNGF
jgi:hypothetical protein